MKKILYILLLSVPVLSFGQRVDIERMIGTKVDHHNQVKADAETSKILDWYLTFDEEGADMAVERMDDSWFKHMEMYIGENIDSIKKSINRDKPELSNNQAITVSLVKVSNTYAVIIYSY